MSIRTRTRVYIVEHTAHITQPLRGLLIHLSGDAEHVTQPVVVT